MQDTTQTRIFISYGRKDGIQLAQRLRSDLAREGYEVWLDTNRLMGGTSWTGESEKALDRSDVVLALLSRGSFTSDICRAEQLRSLRKRRCVIPVLAQPDADRPLHLEARQFRDLSNESIYREQFPKLLEDIIQRIGVPLVQAYRTTYVTVPPLPVNYIERRRELELLRSTVLREESSRRITLTALKGMAGIGKTVLAQALCLDEVTHAAFPDGVIWLNLGKDPRDLVPLLREAGRAVGDSLDGYDSLQTASNQLRSTLRDKAVLLVLDDVWDSRDAAPFLIDSPRSRLLITTRDARIGVALGAGQQTLDVLNLEQSLHLISLWSDCADAGLPQEATQIVHECGRLPLAVAMVGALVRGKPDRWKNVLHKLRNADLESIRQRFPEYPHPDLLRAIEISVDALDEDVRACFLDFAVFPEDSPIPEGAIQTLWQLDEYDVQDKVDQLVDLSLAARDTDRRLRMHDLLLDYLRRRLGPEQLQKKHNELLCSYQERCRHDWSQGPCDGYFFENLSWHLRKAGREDEAVTLVLDFRWIVAKLRACGVISVLTDYEWCAGTNPDARLLQEAIRLSAHVLATNPQQLATQLLGRLPCGRSTIIDSLRNQISQSHGSFWLRPQRQLLTAPGGPLLFTLVGHTARVRTVTVTPSGSRAVSASDDHTLKIWNLNRGILEHTLTGHSDWVRGATLVGDGERLVSASDDHTLKVWNLSTGGEEGSIDTYLDWIRVLLTLADGRRIASVSDDRVIKIWNLESAVVEQTLRGHSAEINCIAITPDGRLLISGSDDRTLRIWRLDQDVPVQVLKGHHARITALAVTPDGQHILSVSADEEVLLWTLSRDADPLCYKFLQRVGGIRNLAITPDARLAIAAAEDNDLHIWDLSNGKQTLFEGHSDCVNSVAVTADGRWAISGSDDGTLKVWDVTRAGECGITRDHRDRVRAVAVTQDGQTALSSSDDHTLGIWDMKTCTLQRRFRNHHWVFGVTPDGLRLVSAAGGGGCQVTDLQSGNRLCTFAGHNDRVRAIAVTPDGRRVVSCGDDSTIRLWDIDTGRETLTIKLAGHWARAVAVSSDSRFAITATEGNSLRLWDLDTGAEVRAYRGHTARVNSLGISSSGKFVVSASDDHTLRVWDFESGESVHTIKGHGAQVNSVAISPGDRLIVSAADDCDLRIWRLETGIELARFTSESPLLTCAVSPTTPAIVAGDRSGALHFCVLEGISEKWSEA